MPYYGFIDLNAEELRNRAIVKVDLYCDGRDGNGYYIINDNAKYNTNFAVNYQFGLIRMSDPISVGLGVAKSVGAFAMGDMLTAGASITSAILQGAHKEVGTTGPSGGTAELEYNQGEIMLIEYFSVPHDAPSNYKDTIGLPDGAVKELSLCGLGYVQTLNASVATGVESVNNIINQYLDGGVYIE